MSSIHSISQVRFGCIQVPVHDTNIKSFRFPTILVTEWRPTKVDEGNEVKYRHPTIGLQNRGREEKVSQLKISQ